MKNMFLFSILIIILFCNCRSDNGRNLPDQLAWTYEMESTDSDASVFIHDPIIHENIVVIPRISFAGKKGELIALDKITGEVIWNWSEADDKHDKDGFSVTSYAYDGILAIGDNNYSAGIDIKTGETLWENIDNVWGYSAINGVNDQIFKAAYIPGERFWVQKADIYTGAWETIYELESIDDFDLDTYTPKAIEWEGKVYLAFHEIYWKQAPSYEAHHFLNLYNITDDSLAWRTDTIPLDNFLSHTPSVFPAFTEGQIMLANEVLYSYNISDGKLKWKKSFDNSLTISTSLVAEDGRVYANSGDAFFVCLDVHNGSEIYRTPTGGTPSTIEIHDNRIYMSGISTSDGNKLLILNVNNGIIEKSIPSPFEDEDSSNNLQFSLAVDKETGWAYTSDYKRFLCYNFE